MGPLLCLIGLANAVSGFRLRLRALHGGARAGFAAVRDRGAVGEHLGYAPAASLTGLVLPLVFPEGRLLSRRWRPALWAALAFIPLWFAGYAFIPQSMGSYFHYLPNPYAYAALDRCSRCSVPGRGVRAGRRAAAAASVVLRWRRADRVGRQQLKWFLAVLPITGVALIAGFFASGDPVNVVLGALAGVLLPVAIGIAVLRYRLYESTSC